MKTTIDNTQRKFYIAETGWSTNSYICNLADIPKVIKEINDQEPYKIYHIWNHQLKAISKKEIDKMFEANQIGFRFITYKPLFKVVKVMRKSQRRQILRKGLTEAEAQRVVKSYPNSSRSIVIYTKQN